MKEPCRAPHVPRPMAGEALLDRRLRWHISYHLRRGARCSILVLWRSSDDGRGVCAPWHESLMSTARSQSMPLAEVARQLRPLLRQTDVVEVEEGAGIGVVLPGTDAEGVGCLYRRLVQEAAGAASHTLVEQVRLTVDHASFDATSDAGQLAAVVHALMGGSSTSSLRLAVPIPGASQGTPGGQQHKDRPSRRKAGHPDRRQSGHPRRSALLDAPGAGGEREALRLQADALGVPYACLPRRLPEGCGDAISVQLARELRAVPIGRTRSTLTVAMHDPTDAGVVQRLSAATGLRIFPVLVAAAELERALDQLAPGKVEPVGQSGRPAGA